jgi:hypothetical protein
MNLYDQLNNWNLINGLLLAPLYAYLFYNFTIKIGKLILEAANFKGYYSLEIIPLTIGIIALSTCIFFFNAFIISYFKYIFIGYSVYYFLFLKLNTRDIYDYAKKLFNNVNFIYFLVFIEFLIIYLITSLPNTKADEMAYHLIETQRIMISKFYNVYLMPEEASSPISMMYQRLGLYFVSLNNIVGLSFLSLYIYIKALKFIYDKYWKKICVKKRILYILPLIFNVDLIVDINSPSSASLAIFVSLVLIYLLIYKSYKIFIILYLYAVLLFCKLSYFPIIIPIMLYYIYNFGKIKLPKLNIIYLVPILYILICISYALKGTGAPFGAFYGHLFNNQIEYNYFKDEGPGFIHPLKAFLIYTFCRWNFIVLICIVPFYLNKSFNFIKLIIFTQIILIYFLMPWEPRYLGGLLLVPYILSIDNITIKYKKLILISSLLPYFFIAGFLSYQRIPYAIGVMPIQNYYEKYIPMWKDFSKIKSLIGDNQTIFYNSYRSYSVYAPFIIINTKFDLKNHEYILCDKNSCSDMDLSRYSLIYENVSSILLTFRNPIHTVQPELLKLYKLNENYLYK